jgi:hypothetical protein
MRFFCLFALVLLTACGGPRSIDCSQRKDADTLRCIDRNAAKGDRATLLACSPFSGSEKIAGLWVTGFEKNDFFEGDRPSGNEVVTRVSDTELVTDEHVRSAAPYDAMEVELVGRRSMCAITKLKPHLILVDEMKVKERRGLVAQ